MSRRSVLSKAAPAALLLALFGANPLAASVEEAHSFAMEAAEPHLKLGFNIRGDSWGGDLKPGKRKVIRHQLFRGNEYWFWLGCSSPDRGLALKIYDRKGRPVHVETKRDKYWVAVRVLAPKTASYLVVISAPDGEGSAADWSLAYGYR